MRKNRSLRIAVLVVFGLILLFFWLYVYKQRHSVNMNETEYIIDGHNARNALDYAGIYTGILPCADCAGIETWVEITYESTYRKKTRYLGKDDSTVYQSEGSFTWDEAGNTITLQGVEAPNKYFVSENYLIHLDLEGKRIIGDLEELYILRKEISG